MSCSGESVDQVISALEGILQTGATYVATDGEAARYDHKLIRETLQELYRRSPTHLACNSTRPRIWAARFGGDYR